MLLLGVSAENIIAMYDAREDERGCRKNGVEEQNLIKKKRDEKDV